DKSELRELGVPLEVGTTSIFDTESGYRIAPRDYALPAIELDPAAAAAVGLAARLWQNASLSSAASSGLRKLRAAGAIGSYEGAGDSSLYSSVELTPVARHEPSLEAFLAAARQRRRVRFGYQRSGFGAENAGASERAAVRELQPWGAVAWHGRWYVVGHDVHRDAPRCFRLSRVVGAVTLVGLADSYTPPAGVDLLSYVAQFAPVERPHTARIRVPKGGAAGLRRWASSVEVEENREPSDRVEEPTEILTVAYDRYEWFAARLTAYGATVTVLEPPGLRDAVIARLRALAQGVGADSKVELASADEGGVGLA
ncbi:MAG: helix-turn-helix transcriptional regulator, partial [Pseudonocardiaceae bacterium]